MKLALLLLLAIPLNVNAAVWTIHANLKTLLSWANAPDHIYQLDGSFTTNSSGVPQSWNIKIIDLTPAIDQSGALITSDPCHLPDNPFYGCAARKTSEGFYFAQFYGGHAADELSIAVSNDGVLSDAHWSGFYQYTGFIDGHVTQSATPVPEPSTYLSIALGLLCLLPKGVFRDKGRRLGKTSDSAVGGV